MRDPNHEARQAKIAEIISEVMECSDTDSVSVHDLALAREVIAASKGTVTWSFAGSTWARLCKAKPESVYPDLKMES